MKNFFQRQSTETYQQKFLPKFKKQLNLKNMDKISKAKILSLYDDKYKIDFLAYRFELLSKWMEKNKEYSKEYIVRLDDMVNKLYLNNELNSHEQQYIKNVQAIVFAKNRNLKQLIVDFSINKGEFVFYRYDLEGFKQFNKKGLSQYTKKPDLYITTKRIIISKDIDIISIYYPSILNYQYSRLKFTLNLVNGQQCQIISNNNRAIIESLKRVLKREKIQFN